MPAPRPRTSFRPQFTLLLLYLFGFFFLFALALALPALIQSFLSLPPEGQEDVQTAARVARDALRNRLPLAFGAGLLATAAAFRMRRLPGLRGPD